MQPSLQDSSLGSKIYFVRGQRIMLDSDLAQVYGVASKRLNEQVKRNAIRFPPDFMFQLTQEEYTTLLRSQIATSKPSKGDSEKEVITTKRGGRRYLPNVFTEHGAIMLASVLNSDAAIQASIYVVRAFTQLREYLSMHAELTLKIEELENRYDAQFSEVFQALRALMNPELPPRRRVGFNTHDEDA